MNTYQQEMIALVLITVTVTMFLLHRYEPRFTHWLDGRKFVKGVPFWAKRRGDN